MVRCVNKKVPAALLVLSVCFACLHQKNKKLQKIVTPLYSDIHKCKCVEPNIDKFVIRADTVSAMPLKVKFLDANGSVIRLFETNSLYQNNTHNWYAHDEIYDPFGRLAYEMNEFGAFPIQQFECFNYTYDAKGELGSKSGYILDRDNSYHIAIHYQNGKEIGRTKERVSANPCQTGFQ